MKFANLAPANTDTAKEFSVSGKSTVIKHIIASEYACGAKIIIIDPEGEYKDMCCNPLFEGDWIDVAGGRDGLINPLQICIVPPDDENEDAVPTEKDSIGDLAIHLKTLETFFGFICLLNDKPRALLNKSFVEAVCSFRYYMGHGYFSLAGVEVPDD